MNTAEMQTRLRTVGFDPGSSDGLIGPMTRTALARFQVACALPGHHLVVDAVPGPRSWAALVEASTTGRLSAHFHVSELRSRTRVGGPKDGPAWVHRHLLLALEELRGAVGRPIAVVSGFRSEGHNAAVGGASRSQHAFGDAPELAAIRGRLSPRASLIAGRAADIPRGVATVDEVRALALFTGIGHRDGRVTHVDVRPGNPLSPAVWRYG
jgi:peptidoglycan hydrolase-like protein with peptidoglycan-binding domain